MTTKSELKNFFRILKWTDFVKVNNSQNPFDAEIKTSFSYILKPLYDITGTDVRVKDNLIVTIELGKNSWVKAEVFNKPVEYQDKLLHHEYGHYRITALCARDFFNDVKILMTKTFKSIQICEAEFKKIEKIYSQTNLKSVQDKYEIETFHGLADTLQKKWDDYFVQAMSTFREQESDGRRYPVTLFNILK
ncbi:MAG: hypothetical protein R6W68_01630 [Ignavibacteriaceae bacterium]